MTALVNSLAKVTVSPEDASSAKVIVVTPAVLALAPTFISIALSATPEIPSRFVMLVKSVSTTVPSAPVF